MNQHLNTYAHIRSLQHTCLKKYPVNLTGEKNVPTSYTLHFTF